MTTAAPIGRQRGIDQELRYSTGCGWANVNPRPTIARGPTATAPRANRSMSSVCVGDAPMRLGIGVAAPIVADRTRTRQVIDWTDS